MFGPLSFIIGAALVGGAGYSAASEAGRNRVLNSFNRKTCTPGWETLRKLLDDERLDRVEVWGSTGAIEKEYNGLKSDHVDGRTWSRPTDGGIDILKLSKKVAEDLEEAGIKAYGREKTWIIQYLTKYKVQEAIIADLGLVLPTSCCGTFGKFEPQDFKHIDAHDYAYSWRDDMLKYTTADMFEAFGELRKMMFQPEFVETYIKSASESTKHLRDYLKYNDYEIYKTEKCCGSFDIPVTFKNLGDWKLRFFYRMINRQNDIKYFKETKLTREYLFSLMKIRDGVYNDNLVDYMSTISNALFLPYIGSTNMHFNVIDYLHRSDRSTFSHVVKNSKINLKNVERYSLNMDKLGIDLWPPNGRFSCYGGPTRCSVDFEYADVIEEQRQFLENVRKLIDKPDKLDNYLSGDFDWWEHNMEKIRNCEI